MDYKIQSPVPKFNYSNETLSVLVEKTNERAQKIEENLKKLDKKFDQMNTNINNYNANLDKTLYGLLEKTYDNEKKTILLKTSFEASADQIEEFEKKLVALVSFHSEEKINKASWKKIITIVSLGGGFVVGLVTVLASLNLL